MAFNVHSITPAAKLAGRGKSICLSPIFGGEIEANSRPISYFLPGTLIAEVVPRQELLPVSFLKPTSIAC
jgi:hypothetical protein